MIPPARHPARPTPGNGPPTTVTRDPFGWWRWEVLAADGTVRKSWGGYESRQAVAAALADYLRGASAHDDTALSPKVAAAAGSAVPGGGDRQ